MIRFDLAYADGGRGALPTEPSQMTYYLHQTRLGGGERTLMDILNNHPVTRLDEGEQLTMSFAFDPPSRLVPKDDYVFPAGDLEAVEWEIVGRMGRPLVGNVLIDPGTLAGSVVYTNALTGDEQRYALDQLPLGDGRVAPGRFYFTTIPLSYFHCAKVERGVVTWEMIESFQCGQLIRVTFTQDQKWARSFIPVTDRKILRRLVKRLNDYRSLRH